MKPNELLIGDWVQVPSLIDDVEQYNAWCKVKQLRDCDLDVIGFKELKYNEIAPIPITLEILEKLGWRKIGRKTYMDEQMCVLANHYDDKWQMSYGGIDDYTNIPNIRYVHELQHALRLCGIEKEIEL